MSNNPVAGCRLELAYTWAPVVVAVCVIGTESTVYFGADRTIGPLRIVYEWLFGPVSFNRWWVIHHLIRKTGHFVGFGLVSAAWFRAWFRTWFRTWFQTWPRTFRARANRFNRAPMELRMKCHVFAMLGTFLVASGDEFHQTFLPNRTGTATDVALDCAGGLLMQILIWAGMQIGKLF